MWKHNNRSHGVNKTKKKIIEPQSLKGACDFDCPCVCINCSIFVVVAATIHSAIIVVVVPPAKPRLFLLIFDICVVCLGIACSYCTYRASVLNRNTQLDANVVIVGCSTYTLAHARL